MSLNKFFPKWSVTMAKAKKVIGHVSKRKEIKIELIPVYISESEFQEKKKDIQNLIARMVVSTQKRGRPSNDQEEDFEYAA
jgi:hypothetical protein